ncbi:hypothetical protein MF271_23935 (plasmid) [Deinococcus sp. KNUC1210]|uniref:hypothetical protein n=1 Tax=Deinococcus sp. KNUC1210 TaxID=2917691 RepID=UPI001EEFDDDC|nr:hypothetical protein [Deinococcus sp. KNUC1210]ULH18014.1 hypothetical protein MF271_23935 [Deinococcus sp. KNUC1210]
MSHPANLQAFETCITAALQILAAVKYAPMFSEARPSPELLLEYVEALERQAREIALLDGNAGVDILALGQDWYARLRGSGVSALMAGFEGVHAAAYLGLAGGTTSAMMLAATACAVRSLAEEQGRLLN